MHLAANFFPQQMELGGVMIACHDYQILGYKNSNFSDLTFNQTRNPLKKWRFAFHYRGRKNSLGYFISR